MSDGTIRMKITKSCFVSEKSKIYRDGQLQERLKVFPGEEHELHIDDATALDELGFAKQVMAKRPIKSEKASDAKATA